VSGVQLATPVRSAATVDIAVTGTALMHRYAPGRGLDPIDFQVAGPGVVAVTGRNGVGKSTLLRIVAGLLQPTGGRCDVVVGGVPRAPGARRTCVGYGAPELSFYDELTVAENLKFATEARGDAGAGAAAAAALAEVGLAGRERDRFAALSSGLKQRLRLAFAILFQPPVLVLDEPGSHLDDAGRELVARLLERQRERGLALVATNDEREVRLADQRIELRGRGVGDPA